MRCGIVERFVSESHKLNCKRDMVFQAVFRISSILLCCVLCTVHTQDNTQANEKVLKQKGHLRPFGESGTRLELDVADEFPPPEEFFRKHVLQSRPIKISGAVRDSRAFRLWTDDYLLSRELPEGEGANVHLETIKKENRSQETLYLNFHEFLKIYNDTEYYMVDDVPKFLSADIMVPCSLQCRELINEKLALAMMWFSSGGTKSVVHTDSFDNINCLLRGEKTFIMVDPARHREKIHLNKEGSHSDIDVDRVDLTKYPELADVEFYHVNMTAGDCLYIPYLWIHQVRSYNSNVAVNFWWGHYPALDAFEKGMSCPETCNRQLTLMDVNLQGDDEGLPHYKGLRDGIINTLISTKSLNQQELNEVLYPVVPSSSEDLPETLAAAMSQVFEQLDTDGDGMFSLEEARQTSLEVWKTVAQDVILVTSMMQDMYPDSDQEEYYHAEQDIKDEL